LRSSNETDMTLPALLEVLRAGAHKAARAVPTLLLGLVIAWLEAYAEMHAQNFGNFEPEDFPPPFY
jgi:hypothetical protein